MMKLIRSALFLLSIVLLASCSKEQVVKNVPEDWPKSLKWAYTPSVENPEERFEYRKEVVEYLSNYIGIPVKLYETGSYGPTIEAIRSGKIDVASGSSFAYMIAAEKTDAEALAVRGFVNEDGSYRLGGYHSLIAVPANSPYNSLEDLKENGSEITFTFVDASSTSGHLIPRGGLEKNGINPDTDFKQVVYTQHHLNSVMTLVSGKVDAGAISLSTYSRLVAKKKIKEDDIKIIWKSPPILNSPVYVRTELPRSLKEAIRSAFVEMAIVDPALLHKRFALYPTSELWGVQWVPAYDFMWDELRDIASRVETMQLLEGRTGLNDWTEDKRQAYLEEQDIEQRTITAIELPNS